MRLQNLSCGAIPLLVLALGACEEITEFPEGGAVVRAAHALPAVRTPAIDFTVNVAVDNWSNRDLFVNETCDWVIQRLVGGEWVDAYLAPCGPPFLAEIAVSPGTSHVFTVMAAAALRVDEGAAPFGTYRIIPRVEASYSRLRRQAVPLEQRTSNPFVVP
jgi:hypothetical protein